MKQLSKEEAIAFDNSKVYETWTSEQIVRFQLFQDKLCLPFKLFMKSLSEVLDRPVYTHEMVRPDHIREEYLGCREKPTFDEIVSIIPEEKRMVIFVD